MLYSSEQPSKLQVTVVSGHRGMVLVDSGEVHYLDEPVAPEDVEASERRAHAIRNVNREFGTMNAQEIAGVLRYIHETRGNEGRQ